MFRRREIFTFQWLGPVLRSISWPLKLVGAFFFTIYPKSIYQMAAKNASRFLKTLWLPFSTRPTVHSCTGVQFEHLHSCTQTVQLCSPPLPSVFWCQEETLLEWSSKLQWTPSTVSVTCVQWIYLLYACMSLNPHLINTLCSQGCSSNNIVTKGRLKKNTSESVIRIIPCRTPPPPLFWELWSALGFFFCDVFWIIGWFRYVLKYILGMFETNFD